MRDLPRRTVTAVVFGAAALVAVAAPPVVLWVALGMAAIFGALELRALRAGSSTRALGAMFFLGLAALGALRELGSTGARFSTPEWIPVLVLLVVLPTWIADVVAYLVGSAVGRRRLAPGISPGKTWEGTIAGIVACAAAVISIAIGFGLPRVPAILIAIGLGPAGLAGDLFESYVKRRAGVKDSGTILPGHGGILDRLDSLTAAALFTLVVDVGYGLSQLGGEGQVDRF